MNKSKLAAIILGGLALLWAAALFFGIPFLYGRKVEALLGQDAQTVRGQLGPPSKELSTTPFACDPKFPCTPGKLRGGPVWLYESSDQAWYLYLDAAGKLAALEAVRPGGLDAGQ